ncbi:hypothetical protein QVD99_007354 [Batrachochytrium dendrobatidis]|nr:hypothetical protein QVD99_007354 [Batrachochytrium dendrobatidis]
MELLALAFIIPGIPFYLFSAFCSAWIFAFVIPLIIFRAIVIALRGVVSAVVHRTLEPIFTRWRAHLRVWAVNGDIWSHPPFSPDISSTTANDADSPSKANLQLMRDEPETSANSCPAPDSIVDCNRQDISSVECSQNKDSIKVPTSCTTSTSLVTPRYLDGTPKRSDSLEYQEAHKDEPAIRIWRRTDEDSEGITIPLEAKPSHLPTNTVQQDPASIPNSTTQHEFQDQKNLVMKELATKLDPTSRPWLLQAVQMTDSPIENSPETSTNLFADLTLPALVAASLYTELNTTQSLCSIPVTDDSAMVTNDCTSETGSAVSEYSSTAEFTSDSDSSNPSNLAFLLSAADSLSQKSITSDNQTDPCVADAGRSLAPKLSNASLGNTQARPYLSVMLVAASCYKEPNPSLEGISPHS